MSLIVLTLEKDFAQEEYVVRNWFLSKPGEYEIGLVIPFKKPRNEGIICHFDVNAALPVPPRDTYEDALVVSIHSLKGEDLVTITPSMRFLEERLGWVCI